MRITDNDGDLNSVGFALTVLIGLISIILLVAIPNAINQHLDRQMRLEIVKQLKDKVELRINTADFKELLD